MKALSNVPTLVTRAALALALAAGLYAATRTSSAQTSCTRTVTNTNDTGAGSLRQAITDSNAATNADTICFNIPAADARHFYYADDGAAGQVSAANVAATTAADDSTIAGIDPDWPHSWWSIQPSSQLPTVTARITIDGYTQPGASQNTQAAGDDAVLRIELSGAGVPGGHGLTLSAGNSAVRGLVVNRLPGSGVFLLEPGDGNRVEGCFLGTDPSGTLAQGNGEAGVKIRSSNNHIGGTAPAQRNLLSGNGPSGSILAGAGARFEAVGGSPGVPTGNLIQGNFIGTNRAGTAALGNNGPGVDIGLSGPSGNTVGGTAAGARNIISGNYQGVHIRGGGSANNTVQGNFIGTDVTGTAALGNAAEGILTTSTGSLIGGTDATDGAVDGQVLARNVISGNLQTGVFY